MMTAVGAWWAVGVLSILGCPLVVAHAVRQSRTRARQVAVRSQRERAAAPFAAPLRRLGCRIRAVLGRPSSAAHDAHLGAAVVALPIGAVVAPVQTAIVAAFVAGFLVVRHRQEQARRDRSILRELPEIVDLYLVALNSGHSVATASIEVAQRGDGLVATALMAVVDRSDRGQSLEAALDTMHHQVGPYARPLTSALVSGLRYGTPVGETLARVGADLRLERRRQAEQAARRLPVVMLFPLVLCVLPAFGLLTVVPVLVESLQSLQL